MKVDDNCFLALKNGAGNIAWLHASWSEWKNMFSLEIYGRDGKLVIDGLGGSYGPEKLTFYKMLPQMGPPETTIWDFPGPDVSWEAEFADFAAAVETGRRATGDIEDALAMHKIIARPTGRAPRDHYPQSLAHYPGRGRHRPAILLLQHEGFLIAAAIDRYVYITIHQTFIEELIVKYSSSNG